jgi:hypothetical protein
MNKQQIKEMVERIIGQDEHFVHDKQTASCMCHSPEQLWFMVRERNKVRQQMREALAKELA